MSRPIRPSRARRAAIAVALTVVPVGLAPAAASASYTTAHQWAGGSISSARQPGDSRYLAHSTIVSMTTSPTKARVRINLRNTRCSTGDTFTGTVVEGPGGDAEHLVIGVQAAHTARERRQRLVYGLSLQSAAPGVLTGTASVRGTFRAGKRRVRCDVTSPVTLRSRSALNQPLQPFSTDPGLARLGFVSTTVKPRVLGAIAIARRADGRLHAIWSEHVACRSGGRRSSFEDNNLAPSFLIRADGTFRGREVIRERGKTKKGRYTYRFVGVIAGRIGSDGIARGSVSSATRYTETGFFPKVCRSKKASFAAAP